jgi:beta-xylosidase
VFRDVSVHDPSVIKVNDTYYVFGSHLAAAKTKNFLNGIWWPRASIPQTRCSRMLVRN